MSIWGVFNKSNGSEQKLVERRLHEQRVEKLTARFLRGEVSVEDYKIGSKDFDHRLDLRRVASKLD